MIEILDGCYKKSIHNFINYSCRFTSLSILFKKKMLIFRIHDNLNIFFTNVCLLRLYISQKLLKFCVLSKRKCENLSSIRLSAGTMPAVPFTKHALCLTFIYPLALRPRRAQMSQRAPCAQTPLPTHNTVHLKCLQICKFHSLTPHLPACYIE